MENLEHLYTSSLMETTDEIDWIMNLLLVNQSYQLLHHHNYIMRKTSGDHEKFTKLQATLEKKRLDYLNQLLNLKGLSYDKAQATNDDPEGTQKKRGRKPKPKFPDNDEFIKAEIK